MKNTLITLAVSAVLITPAIAAPNGQGRPNGGHGGFGQPQNHPLNEAERNTCIPTLTVENANFTEVEKHHLNFMREEEKLARDVYLHLYDKWNSQIFINISRSEQQHMDAIKKFMDVAQMPDSAHPDRGVFNNEVLQNLYNDLIARGETSIEEAFKVGALVEEVDIFDLKVAMAEVENTDIISMFDNLLNGSYNHLRAFTRQLAGDYSAQKMTQADVDAILAETSTQANQGNHQGMGLTANAEQVSTGTCFNTIMQSESGATGNNLHLSAGETININSTIMPASGDIGQHVDLIATANLTPKDSELTYKFMRVNGQWKNWDGNLASLQADRTGVTLNSQEKVDVYQGAVPAGKYSVGIGYRLGQGTVLFNVDSINFESE